MLPNLWSILDIPQSGATSQLLLELFHQQWSPMGLVTLWLLDSTESVQKMPTSQPFQTGEIHSMEPTETFWEQFFRANNGHAFANNRDTNNPLFVLARLCWE